MSAPLSHNYGQDNQNKLFLLLWFSSVSCFSWLCFSSVYSFCFSFYLLCFPFVLCTVYMACAFCTSISIPPPLLQCLQIWNSVMDTVDMSSHQRWSREPRANPIYLLLYSHSKPKSAPPRSLSRSLCSHSQDLGFHCAWEWQLKMLDLSSVVL